MLWAVYGLKRFQKTFKFKNLNMYCKSDKVQLWIVKDMFKGENGETYVELYSGYKVGDNIVVVKTRTEKLSKEEVEALKRFVEDGTIDKKFWVNSQEELLEWLMGNFLM